MPLIQGKSKKAFQQNTEAEMNPGKSPKQSLAIAYSIKRNNAKKMARGGMAMPSADNDMEKPGSIAEEILRKRKEERMMADGGMVDIDENAEESPADAGDEYNEAALKELYDDSQLSDQPEDSNEHGDRLSDEDAHDMIDKIRMKLRAQRGA